MFFFCSFTNDKNIFESFLFQITSNDNVLPIYCWPIPNDVGIIFNAVKSSIHISIDSSLTKLPLFSAITRGGEGISFFNHHSTYSYVCICNKFDLWFRNSNETFRCCSIWTRSSCAKRKPIGRV